MTNILSKFAITLGKINKLKVELAEKLSGFNLPIYIKEEKTHYIFEHGEDVFRIQKDKIEHYLKQQLRKHEILLGLIKHSNNPVKVNKLIQEFNKINIFIGENYYYDC